MRKHVAVVCLAAALLLTGCGTSTSRSSTGLTSTAPSAPLFPSASSATRTGAQATSTTEPVPSKAKLAAIVLRQADLSPSWTATPHEPDPTDAKAQAALVQCVGGRNTAPDQVNDVDSPDFDLNGASIYSSASSFKTQADIDADIAIIHSPKINQCYAQLMETELQASLPPGAVKAATVKVTSGSAGGLTNVVATGTGMLTLVHAGTLVTVYMAFAFITGPHIEADVEVDTVNQPVPASFFRNLTTIVATRAAQA